MKPTCLAVLGPLLLALLGFSAGPVKSASPNRSQALLGALESRSEILPMKQSIAPPHLRQPDVAGLLLGELFGNDGSRPAMLLVIGAAFLGFAHVLRRKGLRQTHRSLRTASDSSFHTTQFQLGGGISC
jgi:hypothetical protein